MRICRVVELVIITGNDSQTDFKSERIRLPGIAESTIEFLGFSMKRKTETDFDQQSELLDILGSMFSFRSSESERFLWWNKIRIVSI